MTDRELMQQALDALETQERFWAAYRYEPHSQTQAAITALRDRLAQTEPGPVAWMTITDYGDEDDIWYENPEGHLLEGWTYKPLYLHPPEVQSEPLEYWNAVEGWVKIDEVRQHFDSVGCGTIYKTAGEDRVPVYTTPPQRKPLTDEEIKKAVLDNPAYGAALMSMVQDDVTVVEFRQAIKGIARAIEAAHGIKP